MSSKGQVFEHFRPCFDIVFLLHHRRQPSMQDCPERKKPPIFYLLFAHIRYVSVLLLHPTVFTSLLQATGLSVLCVRIQSNLHVYNVIQTFTESKQDIASTTLLLCVCVQLCIGSPCHCLHTLTFLSS